MVNGTSQKQELIRRLEAEDEHMELKGEQEVGNSEDTQEVISGNKGQHCDVEKMEEI